MATGIYRLTASIGSLSFDRAVNRTGDGVGGLEIAVPAAESGGLTAKTDAETGTITMASGSHTVQTADIIDIYWTASGVKRSRRNITVGTVNATEVPIGADDSGAGDDIPASITPLAVDVQIPFTAYIDGDELSVLMMLMEYSDSSETAESTVTFIDSGSSEIAGITLKPNVPFLYDITAEQNNPFTGNPIVSGTVTNGSLTNAGTLKVGWLQDATP